MTENEIAKIVVDIAFKIHKDLGPGLFESVYETVMAYELITHYGLFVQRQVSIPFIWKDIKLELGFRSGIIIENKVIVELKAIEKLAPVQATVNAFEINEFKTGITN